MAGTASLGVVAPWIVGLTSCSQQTDSASTSLLGSRIPLERGSLGRGQLARRARSVRAAGTPPENWGRAGRLKSQLGGKKKGSVQKEKSLEGWTEVAASLEVEDGKNKATLHQGKGYVVVKSDDNLFGIDANCASCKFPIIEGKVTMAGDEKGPQIECPLCHSKYSLLDGTVLEYCPKDGPLQWVVGTIKDKAPRENTKVYPTRMSRAGRVYFQFVKASA